MLSKAVAVTDESKYTVENFEDDKELLIFSLKNIDALPERIKHLLSHPEKEMEISENGYQKVQNHTWYVRTRRMLQKMEEDFGISLIREGEGEELEFDLEYPDEQTVVLDAVYELWKMAVLAKDDVGKIERLSKTDLDFLLEKFERFNRQFGKRLKGMEMREIIQDSMRCNQNGKILKDVVELFSLQCEALIGELLLQEKGLKL